VVYWWVDEAPVFDRATENAGTSSLAEVLEQVAKYGVRAIPMAQSPHRLSDSTIEALTTNASLLITTATSPKGARFPRLRDRSPGFEVSAKAGMAQCDRPGRGHPGADVDGQDGVVLWASSPS
jgi:hypothetical protein